MRRWFYHIKNLQSTKTLIYYSNLRICFITLRIYKVLKRRQALCRSAGVLSH